MMKKILTALCAMMITVGASAQMMSGGFRLDNRSVYYGLRMGFTSSHIAGDLDTDAKTGLNLGAVFGLRCSPYIPMFLESGIYYTEKGGKMSLGHDDSTYKYNLSYIEMPLLMKYGVEVADQFAVLPYVGPTFGFGVAGQTKEKFPGGVRKYDSFGDDKFNRFDVGIKLGCGIEWNMLYAELGYQWGITNIGDFPSDDDAYNRHFFMNIGINF
jgi:hypothetical protein